MKKIIACVAGFSLMILCALAPVDAAAQGRGNGRGNNPGMGKGSGRAPVMGVTRPGNPHPGDNHRRHDEKKSRKFRNGHDARDGKWGKPGRGRGRGHHHGHHHGHHGRH